MFGLSLLFMAVTTFVGYTHLPPQIPLFYSMPVASSHIVDVWYLGLLPLISLTLILFNSFVLKRATLNEPLGESIIYIANMCIIVATTYIYMRVIFLVI